MAVASEVVGIGVKAGERSMVGVSAGWLALGISGLRVGSLGFLELPEGGRESR